MVPEVLRQMREAQPEAVLIAKPNAGLPRLVGGQTGYDVSPDDFAVHMRHFQALGAQGLGSCCGSNPAYIAALKAN
jgi:5-methyltetrahydrofolate--homocysteine methyltransferase